MTDREQRVREIIANVLSYHTITTTAGHCLCGEWSPGRGAHTRHVASKVAEELAALLASPPAATNDDDAPPPPSRDMIVLYQARQLLEREGWEYRDGWVKVRVPAAPPTLTEERVEEIATEMRNDVVGDSPGDIGFRSGVGMLMRAILRELRGAGTGTKEES